LSETDSFIEEVAEEVRRDRLYGYARKYGWIVALAIVLIVGAAAFFEYRKSSERSAAEDRGDALLNAVTLSSADLQADALSELLGNGESDVITRLLLASAKLDQDDISGAVEELTSIEQDDALPAVYRQLATLKVIMADADRLPSGDRIERLTALADPQSPYRLMAIELRAEAHIDSGQVDEALKDLASLRNDPTVGQEQRSRAERLIVALGGELREAVLEHSGTDG
jgi:hypothetical protein